MPYLNWKTTSITTALTAHPTLTSQARLALTDTQRAELAGELERIFHGTGSELKLELPQKWTLFWHLRSGAGSKLQLAHPQIDEWVATLYFTAEHGQRLVERLRGGAAGETLAISTLGGMAWGSNLELVIDFA